MNCPQEIIEYMHEFLDNELAAENEKKLRNHLQKCEHCQTYFHDLRKTITLVRGTSHIKAPNDFTASVMKNLPKEKKKVSFQRWLRNHPLITAASVFLILMGGSLVSSWNQDKEFSVSKQPNLVVENDTVIVPEGEVVQGDLIVKNGKVKIEGEVQGDVTVINGQKYLASAGHVTGEIQEVNELFDWLWYHIKKTTKDIFAVYDETKANEQSLE